MASKGENSCVDIEAGPHRPSATGESDCSLCFSDAGEQSWPSTYNSNRVDGYRHSGTWSHEIGGGADESYRSSCCVSDSSFEADLECGDSEIKVSSDNSEKNCRICHLNLESSAPESGAAIVLGCSCKDDLANAHKQCAETWFKIRGNKTCEICCSVAKNIAGIGETEITEHSNESNSTAAEPPVPPTETRSFWQGHRFLNFLLACMIFAFIISWVFHFNVPG